MGAELPLPGDLQAHGSAGAGSRSPLAVKKARRRLDGEASLCAITITREAARTADQRQGARQQAQAPLAMAFRGDEVDASLIDISSGGAKLACTITPVIGERIELTVPGGERIEAVVRWVREGQVGVEFGAGGRSFLPPRDASPPADLPPLQRIDEDPAHARSVKRARVLLAAKLSTPRGQLDARLRDLSCKGALLECAQPLTVGDAVVFRRAETVVPARVAWTNGGRIGLQFDQPIEESEVLIHVNRSPTEPLNHIQALERAGGFSDFRRPSFSDRLSDYERKLARVIGNSLGVSLIDE